jgi:type VI secretion system secreted protein Hcp
MAVQYFLKIRGVEGESADARHRDEIEVESWSWGETNGGGGVSGGGAGRATMTDLSLTARLGRASPKLLLACAAGQHFPSAVLAARRDGGEPADFLTLTLTDVLVRAYEAGGAGAGDPAPYDRVGLGFGRIVMKYRPQKPDGSLGTPVAAGWDLKAGRPA